MVPEERVQGFPPIAGPDARVLVLGTMPSLRSLEAGQYYAHPHNAFWPIAEALLAHAPVSGYVERTAMLVDAKVALWDVLASTVREGSLDSSIVKGTEVPNDIAGFLADHPRVHTVFLNGTKARDLFDRHIAPGLPAGLRLRRVCLPSTSPAHAAMSRAAKLEAWRVVAQAARSDADAGAGA